jgi:hypothetical protein
MTEIIVKTLLLDYSCEKRHLVQKNRLKRSEGFFWAATGLAICLASLAAQLGDFNEPGPGFIGFIVGLFVGAIGIIMVVSASRPAPSGDSSNLGLDTTIKSQPWKPLAYNILLLVAYGVLLNVLGYLIATFLLMCGLFHNKERNWATSCMASIATVAVTYFVFCKWLQIQFPHGILP